MAFFSSILSRNLLRTTGDDCYAANIDFYRHCRGHGTVHRGRIARTIGWEVGDLWATFSIFGVGAALTFLLMLFFSPRNSPSFFAQPAWQLLGGVLGPIYVIILTVVTPAIGIAMTMIGIRQASVQEPDY